MAAAITLGDSEWYLVDVDRQVALSRKSDELGCRLHDLGGEHLRRRLAKVQGARPVVSCSG